MVTVWIGERKQINYCITHLRAFSFQGKLVPVSTYKEMLVNLCSIRYKNHPDDFDHVIELIGGLRRSVARERLYFSTSKDVPDKPIRISDSKYFVETLFNANNAVKLCKKLLRQFGYEEKELGIFIS